MERVVTVAHTIRFTASKLAAGTTPDSGRSAGSREIELDVSDNRVVTNLE